MRLGWYGLTSIEAMALGKPVVCHLDPDAADETDAAFGLPLPHVRADGAALTGVPARARRATPSSSRRSGASSRAYAEAVHASERVAGAGDRGVPGRGDRLSAEPGARRCQDRPPAPYDRGG